jgi:hypothetical protein
VGKWVRGQAWKWERAKVRKWGSGKQGSGKERKKDRVKARKIVGWIVRITEIKSIGGELVWGTMKI